MTSEQRAVWDTLRKKPGTMREFKWSIGGVEYGSESEISHEVKSQLFEKLGIGNANCKTLKLSLIADSIPRGAVITRYARLKNGDFSTDWIEKGWFIANRRTQDGDVWGIEAYDYMRKAENEWIPDPSIEFPLSMKDAAEVIAELMGVSLDPRTILSESYFVDYPAEGYTMRNVLCFIAAANGGNWVMTDKNNLLLVPLFGMPTETNLLIDEWGDTITFGGDAILV